MSRSRSQLALPAFAVTLAMFAGGAAAASPGTHGPLPNGAEPPPDGAATLAPAREDRIGWELLDPATSPPGRDQAAMAYHAGIGQTVLFGGHTDPARTGDTWLFDGQDWTELDLDRSPPGRAHAGTAYDAARGEMVLFGGWAGPGGGVLPPDTWTFDGSQWHKHRPATSPPGWNLSVMAYDAARREVVLFGGYLAGEYRNETWVWDGTTWEQRHPDVSPPFRGTEAMAYSRQRQAMVLVGGAEPGLDDAETWLWDGQAWEQLASGPLTARFNPGMSSFKRRVVLYGGHSEGWWDATTTWVLGANGWRARAQGSEDPDRLYWPSTVFDKSRQEVVLFGGFRDPEHRSDTWVLKDIG